MKYLIIILSLSLIIYFSFFSYKDQDILYIYSEKLRIDSIYNTIPLNKQLELYDKIGNNSPKRYIVEEYLKEKKCLHNQN